MKIAFFDSGVGGLTVLREALRVLPHEAFLYFSDGANAPYGTRKKQEVRKLVMDAVEFIVTQDIDALVIACNTGTSVAIDDLREKYGFPIIGMEPAVKPALAAAQGKRVLVFATKLTLKLEKFKHLVAKIDTDHKVDYLPLQELVRFAEDSVFDTGIIVPYLQEKLSKIDLNEYGAIVLGCTHFPYYRLQIRQILPDHIQILDGNMGTVRNLMNKVQGLPSAQKPTPSIDFFLSGKKGDAAFFQQYLGNGM